MGKRKKEFGLNKKKGKTNALFKLKRWEKITKLKKKIESKVI